MTDMDSQASASDPHCRVDPGLAAILAVYILLCLAYMAAIPPGYGPDEMLHFGTTRMIAEHGELPISLGGMRGATGGGHAFHPPLYHALGIPIYYAFRPAEGGSPNLCIRALRFMSLAWGLAALWQFWLLLGAILPERRALRLGALAVVAMLPEYLLVSSVVLNDIAAVFFGILLLRTLVQMLREPEDRRWAIYTGLAMAGFANAKGQILMLLPLCAGWLIALVLWRRLNLRRALAYAGISYGLLLVLGSWWYIRNYTIYGQILPPGLDEWAPRAPGGHRLTPLELYSSGLFAQLLWRSMVGLGESVWSQVDWFLNPPPPGVVPPIPSTAPYALLGAITAAAALGHFRAYMARRGRQAEAALGEPSLASRAIWLSYAEFGLIYAAVTYMAVFVHLGWYQGGRYLTPAIGALAVFLVTGHIALAPKLECPASFFSGSVLLLLNGLCLYNIVAFLNPAYAGG